MSQMSCPKSTAVERFFLLFTHFLWIIVVNMEKIVNLYKFNGFLDVILKQQKYWHEFYS